LSTPYLSIVVPAYNEERRLPFTLEKILAYLDQQAFPSEVLVVENGSQDRTLAIAQEFAGRHAGVRALHEEERGKGRAVSRGMLEARGEYRFMCDADLSMPIEELDHFMALARRGFDIAIASREAPGAIRYHEPFYRHFGGRVINLMIRILALPGLQDTQCGFKCFRAQVAEDLFPRLTLGGWSFDVELLYIARLRGYRIEELPIQWYFSAESKINPVRDAVQMGLDLLAIRRNALLGLYQAHENQKP
jgi:dolichyl-phosphate beta-glucosyltransferase